MSLFWERGGGSPDPEAAPHSHLSQPTFGKPIERTPWSRAWSARQDAWVASEGGEKSAWRIHPTEVRQKHGREPPGDVELLYVSLRCDSVSSTPPK